MKRALVRSDDTSDLLVLQAEITVRELDDLELVLDGSCRCRHREAPAEASALALVPPRCE
jgi:hypothetical protein